MPLMQGPSRVIGTTFEGFCFDTPDALLLFEAVFQRRVPYIPRRLVPGEYRDLVKSGSIFIYEEHESGIKRWTDGRAWSPSRVLDNFLVYRESEKISPTIEKKKALKRKLSNSFDEVPESHKKRKDSVALESPEIGRAEQASEPSPEPAPPKKRATSPEEKELIKSLAGSFTDDSVCRNDGLVKKTISVVVSGLTFHMVSYYTIEDIKNNVLVRPSRDQRFKNLSIRPDLYRQNFRQPVYMPFDHSAASVSPTVPQQPTASDVQPHSNSVSPNPDVFLSMAPGTHRIQLRQNPVMSSSQHYSQPNHNSAAPPTTATTTATSPYNYQQAHFQYPATSTKQNFHGGIPRAAANRMMNNGHTATSSASPAVQSPRPAIEWHGASGAGWQPRGFYNPNMPGFVWSDASTSFGVQHQHQQHATPAYASTAPGLQASDSQMMLMAAAAEAARNSRPLLPAPEGSGVGRGYAVR